jgi:hypothetical protein
MDVIHGLLRLLSCGRDQVHSLGSKTGEDRQTNALGSLHQLLRDSWIKMPQVARMNAGDDQGVPWRGGL